MGFNFDDNINNEINITDNFRFITITHFGIQESKWKLINALKYAEITPDQIRYENTNLSIYFMTCDELYNYISKIDQYTTGLYTNESYEMSKTIRKIKMSISTDIDFGQNHIDVFDFTTIQQTFPNKNFVIQNACINQLRYCNDYLPLHLMNVHISHAIRQYYMYSKHIDNDEELIHFFKRNNSIINKITSEYVSVKY